MNREIKIKVWNDIKICNVRAIDFNYDFYEDEHSHIHNITNETIFLQFTGLKDKNGVEIYDEDICKFYELVNGDGCGNSEWKTHVGKIIFEHGCYKFKFGKSKVIIAQLCGDLERLVNYYENPELLEEGKNEY